MANKRQRAQRRRKAQAGRPTAGPAGAPLDPDGLYYGTASELRKMAESLTAGDRTTTARLASASAKRVKAYRSRHPDADPPTLVGRPICETDTRERDRDRAPVQAGLRVVAASSGPAHLWIDDYIEAPNYWDDGISARAVREALDEIGNRDVVVHMNSGGGDFFEGVAIYQALRDHDGDVYVAVEALAASAASVIAMAGDTIGIGSMAFIMIHEARAFAYGNADDLMAMAGVLDGIGESMASTYAKRGPDSSDSAYFRDLMRAETWMDSTRAVEEGLADEDLDPDQTDTSDDSDDLAEEDADAVAVAVAMGLPSLRPAATTKPTPAPPAPAPDPVNWATLFTDDDELDMEALLT